MEKGPKSPKSKSWDNISPELLAFVREPVAADPDSAKPALHEEMQQGRREWNEFVATLPPGVSDPASPEAKPPVGNGPERFIGPRNPDHPGVNGGKGGRDPS